MSRKQPSKHLAVVPFQTADKTFSTAPPQDHPCTLYDGIRLYTLEGRIIVVAHNVKYWRTVWGSNEAIPPGPGV